MTWEMILFGILFVVLIFLLIRNRRLEGRKIKGRTRDYLSDSLSQEIQEERESAKRKKELFDEAMKKSS